ncbi:MAG: pyrroline-5-carboxylate reductase [Bacteroidetes bacterium]|nr:pyrroline-5-carboxylate reductase [Bacteroidota bacterium]
MKVTIIGCGNMGLVYARAFLRYNIVSKSELLLAEKNESRRDHLLQLDLGEVVLADDPKISQSELIILALKPQDFHELAPKIKMNLNPNVIILSIMAGITITQLENYLAHSTIIRAMPNSPVEVGMGMTGFSAHASVTMAQVHKVENLLATTGRTAYFENENLLNAVTALSGSGPAYFYYILRAMIDAGKQMGMEETTATTLVKQTMLGAFHLVNNADKSFDELIKTVASKGGTTEAAIKVFEEQGLHKALVDGILRAEARGIELAGN